ncbi:hypothetical protein PS385_09130 [Limosilactobacillus fermentum]
MTMMNFEQPWHYHWSRYQLMIRMKTKLLMNLTLDCHGKLSLR